MTPTRTAKRGTTKKRTAKKKVAKAAPKTAAAKKSAATKKVAAKKVVAKKPVAKPAAKKKKVATKGAVAKPAGAKLADLAAGFQPAYDAAQAKLTAEHRIGRGGSWSYDQTTMQLRFTPPPDDAEGRVVVARASVLGSWSNESWLWAWANGSLLASVSAASTEVKKAGRKLGLSELTSATYFASPEVVQRVAIVSFGVLEAVGCYFATTATGRIVFVLHAIA